MARFRAGRVIGYLIRNSNGGAFVAARKLKAFCKLAALEEMVWGKKHYVVLVKNGEDEKEPVGYIALSRNGNHFYVVARGEGVEAMGWVSMLGEFLKGKAKRCPIHQRIPITEAERDEVLVR